MEVEALTDRGQTPRRWLLQDVDAFRDQRAGVVDHLKESSRAGKPIGQQNILDARAAGT